VAGLAYYRKLNPSSAIDLVYTFVFVAVFAYSIVHFYLRIRKTRPPQE
jgi:hypothetical protein